MALAAKSSLKVFYNTVWRDAFLAAHPDEFFLPGKHTDRWCDELQAHKKTSKESARLHLKSSTLYAYIGWVIFRRTGPREILYISYSHDLAAYHISKAGEILRAGSFFSGLKWNSDAESVIDCHWDDNPTLRYVVEPAGVLTFKRGRHPHEVLCDDILRDPTMRKLNTDQIMYVNTIFREQITMLPKDAIIHVWGTAQDAEDLFKENRRKPGWHCTTERAYEPDTKTPLWPERYPYKKLMELRSDMGERAFAKEMMCAPVRGEESYFTDAAIKAIINPKAENFDLLKGTFDSETTVVVGGFDIGKKRHPSHLSVGYLTPEGKLIQIYSKFMDGWEYTDQLAHVAMVEEKLGLDRVLYDNTRTEFEVIDEQGNLPACMSIKDKDRKNTCAVTLTAKANFALAASFERWVNKKRLELLPDDRQRRLILTVDNDLKAVETSEGHGDSFFSVGLMCQAADFYSHEDTGTHKSAIINMGSKQEDEDIGFRFGSSSYDPASASETMAGLGRFG